MWQPKHGVRQLLDETLPQRMSTVRFIREAKLFLGFQVCWVSLVQQREKGERCGVLLPIAAAETEQRPAHLEPAHGEDRQPAQGQFGLNREMRHDRHPKPRGDRPFNRFRAAQDHCDPL